MRTRNTTNLDLLEYYYGDLIENIIIENRYPIDLDDDYDYLLRYTYRSLIKAWFGGKEPSPEKFESKLKSVRERSKTKLSILLSYIISRYASLKNEEIIGRIHRDDKQ
jgi:hypothetical protein